MLINNSMLCNAVVIPLFTGTPFFFTSKTFPHLARSLFSSLSTKAILAFKEVSFKREKFKVRNFVILNQSSITRVSCILRSSLVSSLRGWLTEVHLAKTRLPSFTPYNSRWILERNSKTSSIRLVNIRSA